MIDPKSRYKIAFIINWGTFVWEIMPILAQGVPPTYQWASEYNFQGLS
jgi:hypothetical protein